MVIFSPGALAVPDSVERNRATSLVAEEVTAKE